MTTETYDSGTGVNDSYDSSYITNAYNQAIRYQAIREHSAYELYRKLLAKGYSEDEVAETIHALVEKKVVDDGRFSEIYLNSRINKGFGPVKIRAELRDRGIDRAITDQCLRQIEVNWVKIASKTRTKHFGKGIPTEFTEKAKQIRYLESRGFTPEQIKAVADKG